MQEHNESVETLVMRMDAGNGQFVDFPATCLLVFLDETGEDSLSDPHYPLFGIGGCVITAARYELTVNQPWRYMMGKWFGGPDKIFHATDYSGGQGTSEQYEALTHYFTKFPIGRIASIFTKLTSNEVDVQTYQLVSASIFERLKHVAKVFEFTEVAIIVEASSKYDQLANQYLFAGNENLRVLVGGVNHEIKLRKFLLPKSAGECGLQIADAIANAAGGQARARWKGAKKQNKDFQVVFGDAVDKRWASYMEITRVTEK